ncbi:MAG: AAA family ATPase [Candidatus Eisenbacteria bacterium]|uniref:AAA family ATPase n=1 Tax=Eiseniibacteriota bacterium TaxID=2212470 RepID=A0A948RRI5_UNCEI|nr:AAA family ATPase [Candidatus Eisenbacteria bacterium]MBU1947975.1 AAA family ATPase [Candidatus Eisenbacteria bacterium]MBU2689535.1 AAA family ATPase [Candidatus Eisenbacteria bacterium]
MDTVRRILNIDLPERQSVFLWGPRMTGKTTLLRQQFPKSLYYDLLQTDLFLELSRNPSLLREQLLAVDDKALRQPVIIDEVQKTPQLLDEIHWLIENRRIRFILSGSSARKLIRGNANLLGGRAWRYHLFPLVSQELESLDILRILNRGLIPNHYFQNGYRKSQKAYVHDYLKEEVFEEGLTRNIPAFSRFFEAMAYSHGELTNFANIARDSGVDAKTVKEYYQILVDTLLGVWVAPFKRRQDRHVIQKAAKFYLFDVGVAGTLLNRDISVERGEAFGKALEHFILMELRAHASYRELDYPIHFWRTKSGLEVDFVLGNGEVAIEVKGTSRVDRRDLHALRSFKDSYKPKSAIVVCNEKRERLHEGFRIMPVAKFLQELWSGRIINSGL